MPLKNGGKTAESAVGMLPLDGFDFKGNEWAASKNSRPWL
jgi:hypothetical protein